MMPEELKTYSCSFADWKKEYESNQSHRIHRAYRKAGGMFSWIGSSTEEIYDKWIGRSVMTFEEAMRLANAGSAVTRPRMWSVHQMSIRLKDGILCFYVEEEGFGGPYGPGKGYPDDEKATDWEEVKIKNI